MLACGLPLLAAQAASPVSEAVLQAPGPHGALEGTLLAPAGEGAPVVLIIPGSGPTDRDGNSPLGIRASTYRLLAEGLAAQGIATLRVDKRGMFGSRAAVPDANAVIMPDYAADIRAWISILRQRDAAPCVWLLGHSEGGLAALLAAQEPAGICGLLLLSAVGRSLGAVLGEQLAANPANAPLLEQAQTIIAQLAAGQRVDAAAMHPALVPLFNPAVQGFLSSAIALDPAALAASTRLPMLILQGLRDLQVGRADAERLHQARPDATLVLVPDANHVLKSVAGEDRATNVATYLDPDLPLAPGVVEAIADFIRASASGR